MDVKSHIAVLSGHVPASRSSAVLVGSTVVDMGLYLSGCFFLHVGAVSSGGSVAGKLQHSSSATFASDVNDDGGTTGNSAAQTVSTSNTVARFFVNQIEDETEPYYRLAVTDAGAAVIYSSSFVGRAKVAPVTYS